MDKRLQLLGEKISIQKVSNTTQAETETLVNANIAYYNEIYKYLEKFTNENLEVVYRVNAKITKRQFQDMYVWEMKIFSVTKVGSGSINKEIWERETCLIERINLTPNVLDGVSEIKKQKEIEKLNENEKKEAEGGLQFPEEQKKEGEGSKKGFGRQLTVKRGGPEKFQDIHKKLLESQQQQQSEENQKLISQNAEGEPEPSHPKPADKAESHVEAEKPTPKAGGIVGRLFGFGKKKDPPADSKPAEAKKEAPSEAVKPVLGNSTPTVVVKKEEAKPDENPPRMTKLAGFISGLGRSPQASEISKPAVNENLGSKPDLTSKGPSGIANGGGQGITHRKSLIYEQSSKASGLNEGRMPSGGDNKSPLQYPSMSKLQTNAGKEGVKGWNKYVKTRMKEVNKNNLMLKDNKQNLENQKNLQQLPLKFKKKDIELKEEIKEEEESASSGREGGSTDRFTAEAEIETKNVAGMEKKRNGIIREIQDLGRYSNGEIQFAENSSVGSSMSTHFGQKDTLKKIRSSIKAKSAPLNLKLAVGLLASCLFFCIGINISTEVLSYNVYNQIINFSWDTASLTTLLIKYNKLASFLEYVRIQNNYSSTNTWAQIYPSDMVSNLNFDINRTLSTAISLKEAIITDSLNSKKISTIVQFFMYTSRTFNYSGVMREVPTEVFFDNMINFFYNYLSNGFSNDPVLSYKMLSLLSSDLISSNENAMLQFNLDYFKKSLETSKTLQTSQLVVQLLDICLRIFVMGVCLLVSVPAFYISLQKSGEILQMISKISAVNIRMYTNHYNKLISLLGGENLNYSAAVKKTNEDYIRLLREKEKNERKVYKFRRNETKDNKKKKVVWTLLGLLLFIVLIGLQCSKAVLQMIVRPTVSTSLDAIVKIPNTINSYSAINLLTFKLLYYSLMNISKDNTYNTSYSLMNQFFTETVNSKETIGESRLEIQDDIFQTVYNNLFASNLCDTIFGKTVDLTL